MSTHDTLEARQLAFAAHLRDARMPAPEGIEERRLALYRRLFFNTMEGLLANNFPVIRQTLGEREWTRRVADFQREHRCRTPLFTEIAQEFITWLAAQAELDPPWLAELAHYEWMELRAAIDDTPPPPHLADGDLFSGIPVLSPQVWPLAYAWPVQRIGPRFQPRQAPDAPTLLLVRRDRRLNVHFAAISPLVFRLLQLIADNEDDSGEHLLGTLAAEAGADGDAAFHEEARHMLQRLHAEDSVLGIRPHQAKSARNASRTD
ncbi:HvfC family RiPP maturation protein [Luteimonas sp. e5]